MATTPTSKHLTAAAGKETCPSPALDAALLALVADGLAVCVWLMLNVAMADETEVVVSIELIASVAEVVVDDPDALFELIATEIDPTTPDVVVEALPIPPLDVPVALALVLPGAFVLVLALALAGPSLSAPAVTPTGKYVISAGPSVDVTSSVVLYPLSVWLWVHTAWVVPARLHAMLSPAITICRVVGPSTMVAPPP